MKYYLIMILSLILMSYVSFAEEITDELLHPVAHMAGSYALTHVGTVVCKKVTHLSSLPCSLMGGAVAGLLGIGVELSQDQTAGNWKKGIAYDAAGIGLSIGVIHWDF